MTHWNDAMTNKEYYMGDMKNPIRLIVMDLIKKDETFLDVGCGNGGTYQMFKEKAFNLKYKGIDYAENAIKNAKEKFPEAEFEVMSVEQLNEIPDNSYDTVYMRHCLENVRNWQEALRQMFRISKKRLIVDMRRPFVRFECKLVEDLGDTVCWDIDGDEFNIIARNMTVNVSYLEAKGGWIGDSSVFAVLGKKLDDVVFTLDDFHETNHKLELLHDMKKRFPKLKVTLFVIPSKSSIEWLKRVKEDYFEYAVHGWFHDITTRPYDDGSLYPEECLNWTEEDANKYLKKAEEMGVFIKGFKAPGWGMNTQTYKVLKDRGYWVMDNKDRSHERPDWVDNNFESGSLVEVNGHIQFTAFNGLEELASERKCNFKQDTNFHFVSDIINKPLNNKRLQCLFRDQTPTPK